VAALLNFQLKFDKKGFLVALLFQQLTAARLQHLLKKPRDGLTPPRVIFYKTRFKAAFNRLLECACIFSAGLCNLNYRIAAPEKITALGEAPGSKADYHQFCLFYCPKPKYLPVLSFSRRALFSSTPCTNPQF